MFQNVLKNLTLLPGKTDTISCKQRSLFVNLVLFTHAISWYVESKKGIDATVKQLLSQKSKTGRPHTLMQHFESDKLCILNLVKKVRFNGNKNTTIPKYKST